MYIWTGCKLPDEFETHIRARCVPIARELGLDITGFSLPQHISLKISFEAGNRYPEILDQIASLLRRESRFAVFPAGIEQHGGYPVDHLPGKRNPSPPARAAGQHTGAEVSYPPAYV